MPLRASRAEKHLQMPCNNRQTTLGHQKGPGRTLMIHLNLTLKAIVLQSNSNFHHRMPNHNQQRSRIWSLYERSVPRALRVPRGPLGSRKASTASEVGLHLRGSAILATSERRPSGAVVRTEPGPSAMRAACITPNSCEKGIRTILAKRRLLIWRLSVPLLGQQILPTNRRGLPSRRRNPANRSLRRLWIPSRLLSTIRARSSL